MSVTLLRSYATFASGATVTLPDSTEAALIAQGIAVAAESTAVPAVVGGPLQFVTQNGNVAAAPQGGYTTPSVDQGPRILPNVPINAFASLGTSAVHVAGSLYVSEIQVPHYATWTGIGVLNGATVGTDNGLVALYGSDGRFIRSSALAGALSAGANAFQNRAFTSAVTLAPGRYFIVSQFNGTTATTRRIAATMGGNTMSAVIAGTFGTLPATITVPTTFTADAGPIGWLYV